MALVLLPCDLPTWPTLQRHLNAMKREVRTAVQLKDALLKIYNLCKYIVNSFFFFFFFLLDY